MKKSILALILLCSVTGCANVKFQWVASYQTENIAADLERARQVKE